MKQLIITFISILFCSQIFAQSIPNNNFDDWYFGGIDRIWDWSTSEGSVAGEPNMAIYYVHGDFRRYNDPAIRLKTWIDNNDSINTSFIYAGSKNLYNWNTGDFELDLMKTGQPFSHRPAKMNGFYMFENDSLFTNDFGKGLVFLKKFNPVTQTADTIGYGNINLPITNTDTIYQPFEIDINYISNDLPDSIVIAFFSTGLGVAGGTLYIDSLTFGNSSFANEIPKLKGVQIQPNPVVDFLDVIIKEDNFSEDLNLFITDMSGKLLLQKQLKQINSRVNVKDLPKGIYFLTIQNHKNRTIEKFIKL